METLEKVKKKTIKPVKINSRLKLKRRTIGIVEETITMCSKPTWDNSTCGPPRTYSPPMC